MLHQNIQLLQKINEIRSYREDVIKTLLEQISRIKSDRNLFIHGIWGSPNKSDNDIQIVCKHRRTLYKSEKDTKGEVIQKKWIMNKSQIYNLSYIKRQITKIEDILLSQEYLIKELENETFT